MLAVLDARLFDEGAVRELDLLELLSFFTRRRHHAAVTEPVFDGTSPSEIRQWLEKHSTSVADELGRYLAEIGPDRAALSGAGVRRIRVVPGHRSSWQGPVPRLTVADARSILQRPLKLLVEDRDSDFAFLKMATPPQWRTEMNSALESGAIEVEHGGGIGRMKTRVHDAVTGPSPADRARLWVMCDSDRRAPDEPDETSEALVDACRSGSEPWPIPCYQLRRRSIENYLPLAWLRRWPYISKPTNRQTRERQARVLTTKVLERRLNPTQRAHYNVKSGLLGDIRNDKKVKMRAYRETGDAIRDEDLHPLFHALGAEHRRSLHDGLGEDVASMFAYSPQGRARHALDESAFHDEVPGDEFEAMLTSIFDWI